MKDFEKVIWRDAMTFVDFFASWCGPCHMMASIVERFQQQMNGRIDVYKIDIDNREMREIIDRYNIRSIPTLMFFRRGEVLWRHSGVMSYEQLMTVLNELEQHEHARQH